MWHLLVQRSSSFGNLQARVADYITGHKRLEVVAILLASLPLELQACLVVSAVIVPFFKASAISCLQRL